MDLMDEFVLPYADVDGWILLRVWRCTGEHEAVVVGPLGMHQLYSRKNRPGAVVDPYFDELEDEEIIHIIKHLDRTV